MTYPSDPNEPQYPYGATPPAPPPPPPQRTRHMRKRHVWQWIIGGVVAVVVISVAIGAATSGGGSTHVSQSQANTAPSTPDTSTASTPADSPANPPPIVEEPANPDGTFESTCDYELSDDVDNYDTHAGDLDAEVDVTNTGNVGIVVKITLRWHQLGHASIVQHKKVRVSYGKTKTVPFTRPASGNEIDRLQSWNSGHEGKPLCAVGGDLVDTFGKTH